MPAVVEECHKAVDKEHDVDVCNRAIRASLTFLVGTAVLVGCADADLQAPSASGWTRVADSPLSPRFGALAFWVDDRIVITGGSDGRPCPPNADCAPSTTPPLRDGAAFDPATGGWHDIASAPVALEGASTAILDDMVYLLIRGSDWVPGSAPAFVAYDARRDRWLDLPLPPDGKDTGLILAAAGDQVIAYQGSQENGVAHDLVFDPLDETWSELPPDPLIRSFDRTMVWTDAGLVLFGIEDVPQPGSIEPALYRAAVIDLETLKWRRLPDSEVVGYEPAWFWSGGQVVNPTLGTSDGGEVNGWGRSYPHGGMLEPKRGMWSALPDAPPSSGYPGVSLAGDDYVVSLMGAVLHAPSGTWFELPPPPGSAGEGQAITWAGDSLFVWGGVRWDGDEPSIVSDPWLWRPPGER